MELFRLFGSVLIDDQDAIKSLKGVDKKAEETTGTLGKIVGGAAKVGTAVVGAGMLATGAMIGVAKKTSDYGDRVDKLSQKIGMSREGFQEWDYILSQNGMSIESLQGGMKTLNNSFDDMKNGGETTTKAFERLGLSMEDLEGMSREDMFEATVAALQGVEDESERAALATQLFGRSGSEMAPLLNQSEESIKGLKKQAHELGLVMEDSAIDSAASLTDSLDSMQRAIGGLVNKLGAALMPILDSVIKVILNNMPMIQGIFERLAPILASAFEKLLPPIMELAEKLLPVFFELIEQILPFLAELVEAIMPIFTDLLDMLLPPLIEIIKALLPVLLDVLRPLLPLLRPILALLQPFIDLLLMILEPLLDLINLILPPLARLFANLANRVLPPLTRVLGFLGRMVGETVKNAFDKIRPIVEGVQRVFQNISNWINNVFIRNWTNVWNKARDIFSRVFGSIKDVVKAPINWIIDQLNKFIRGLGKLKIPDWVPGVGGKGFSIPEIPRLKVGMDYVPYDEFPAILHKGERVLTADENRRYSGKEDSKPQASIVEHRISGVISVDSPVDKMGARQIVSIVLSELMEEAGLAGALV